MKGKDKFIYYSEKCSFVHSLFIISKSIWQNLENGWEVV